MGFWHEQNRIDRDQYVTIDWNNIQPALKFAFFKKEDPTNDLPNCSNDPNLPQSTTFDHCDHGVTGETYGLPYDYRSIMHYGRNL